MIMAAEEEMVPATREMKVEEGNTYVAVNLSGCEWKRKDAEKN